MTSARQTYWSRRFALVKVIFEFEPSTLFQFHPELYQKDTDSFRDVSSQVVLGLL